MKYFQEADFPHYYIIITNCLPSVNSKKVKSGVSPPPPVSYLSWDYFICSSVTVISRYFLKCRTACCRLHPYFNIWGLFHLRLGNYYLWHYLKYRYAACRRSHLVRNYSNKTLICGSVTIVCGYHLKCRSAYCLSRPCAIVQRLFHLRLGNSRCIAGGTQPWDTVVTGKAAAYLGRFAVFIGTADDYITLGCGKAAEQKLYIICAVVGEYKYPLPEGLFRSPQSRHCRQAHDNSRKYENNSGLISYIHKSTSVFHIMMKTRRCSDIIFSMLREQTGAA